MRLKFEQVQTFPKRHGKELPFIACRLRETLISLVTLHITRFLLPRDFNTVGYVANHAAFSTAGHEYCELRAEYAVFITTGH